MSEIKLKNFTPLFDELIKRYKDFGDGSSNYSYALVFGRIWRYAQSREYGFTCIASQTTIGREVGLSRATVCKIVKQLVKDGYLIDLNEDAGARGQCHRYKVNKMLKVEINIELIDDDEPAEPVKPVDTPVKPVDTPVKPVDTPVKPVDTIKQVNIQDNIDNTISDLQSSKSNPANANQKQPSTRKKKVSDNPEGQTGEVAPPADPLAFLPGAHRPYADAFIAGLRQANLDPASLMPIKKDHSGWVKTINEWISRKLTPDMIRVAVVKQKAKGWDIFGPQSVTKQAMGVTAAELGRAANIYTAGDKLE